MNRILKTLAPMALAVAACVSQVVHAGVIAAPVAVVADTMGTAAGSTANLINQSGLSTGYVSGVTDFASYIGGGPTHVLNSATTAWASNSGPTLGYLDFDLGSVLSIQNFALWTQGNTNAVNSFTLFSALDPGFTMSLANLGSFNAAIGLNAQTFAVSGNGEFVRLQINSIHGGPNVNIGEVAFDVAAASTVPEPASIALLGLGLLGFGISRRKKS